MLSDQATGGGGGSVFPTLPPGTPGYAIVAVSVAVVVVVVVRFAATIIQPRTPKADKPAEATQPAVGAGSKPAEADYQMARETIDRLERQLAKAESEQDAIRAAYEQQKERNHALELQLAARDNSLASARDEIATLRATITALQSPPQRPLPGWDQRQQQRPSRPQHPVVPRRPPIEADLLDQRVDSRVDPDAITDPIPGGRP